MIIGVTGHRSIGGYNYPNPTYEFVYKETKKYFQANYPEKIITGMALGYDTICAIIASRLDIPFVAAVPFVGQESQWSDKQKRIYETLLSKAKEIIVVSPGNYEAKKMQIRNQWMVDNSDKMLACFDGSKGGTYNCVQYAKLKNKIVDVINPNLI